MTDDVPTSESTPTVDNYPLDAGLPPPRKKRPERPTFIVKASLPVNGQGDAIVQTRNNVQFWCLPMDQRLLKRFDDERVRYFHAVLRADGSVKLMKIAPCQDW